MNFSFLLLEIYFVFIYASLCVCGFVCGYSQKHGEGIGFPGAGAVSHLLWVLGTNLRSSLRAASILN